MIARRRSRVKRVMDFVDSSPRKGWYIAVLLMLNYAWDATGHWPL